MKKFISITLLTLAFNIGYAQQKKFDFDDLKSGKYIPNNNKIHFTGNWISENGDYAVKISTKSKEIRDKDLNFTTDILILSFIKLIHNNNNLAPKIQAIEFQAYTEQTDFLAITTDPITNNTVKFRLEKINNYKIKLFAIIPQFSLSSDRKKGITFPNQIEFFKQKDN